MKKKTCSGARILEREREREREGVGEENSKRRERVD